MARGQLLPLPESEEELAQETIHCVGMGPSSACGWEGGCLCPQGSLTSGSFGVLTPSVLPQRVPGDWKGVLSGVCVCTHTHRHTHTLTLAASP